MKQIKTWPENKNGDENGRAFIVGSPILHYIEADWVLCPVPTSS